MLQRPSSITKSTGIQSISLIDTSVEASLPMALDSIKAGFPSAAEDFMERDLDLNELLIKHKAATFMVKVDGSSMVNAGIYHDDILVVDKSLDADNEDVIIAVVDGELTVKRYVNKGGRRELVAESDDFPNIKLDDVGELLIWGVVTTNLRRFRK